MKDDVIVDMRDAFFDQLYRYISIDKNVVILTADHGAFGLKKIENDYPEQYLNIGIAEQALVSIAAGLAKCGKKVYIYAINNFVSLRVLEQINIDLCAMNLDVNIIGVGAGFTYSTDGPTHQGVQDLSAMINLPNLQVYNVTDDINTKKLVELSYNNSGPKYFRIEKGKLPRIYSPADDVSGGQKVITPQDSDYVIISSGYMTQKVNNVVKSLSEQNILLRHMDLFRISPLPISDIVSFTKNKNVIIVEDNIKNGGIAEKVFCLLKEHQHTGRVLSISLKNKFYFDFGDRDMLHKIAKIDEDSITEKIKSFIH
tara:strand:+ start:30014 stop:30952 length:939 start_codon:yes stop_codon:yes gene_type:complete